MFIDNLPKWYYHPMPTMMQLFPIGRLFAALVLCLASSISVLAAPLDDLELALPIEDLAPSAASDSGTTSEPGADRTPEKPLPETPAGADLQAAQEAFKNADIKKCLIHLRNAAASTPNLAPPKLMLASMYLSNGDTAQGRGLLEQAAHEDPHHR